MSTKITHHRRRSTLVFVWDNTFVNTGRRVAQMCMQDAIVFQNDGAFGSGDFQPSRITGMGRRGCPKNTQRSVGKFKDRNRGVFPFNCVEGRSLTGLHPHYVSQQPEQQVHGVHRLVDHRTSAVQRQSSTPSRTTVVFRGPVPLHAGVDQHRLADHAFVDPLLEMTNTRFEPVLKHDAKLHPRAFRSFDKCIGDKGRGPFRI